MKTKREKTLLLVFLGLTVALGSLLSYTMYLYIGVAGLFADLGENLTVEKIEMYTRDSSKQMSVTITVFNSFAGSYLKVYIAIKELRIGEKAIALYSGAVQFDGTFTYLNVPSLSNGTAKLSFDVSSFSISPQDLQNLRVRIRLLATTVVNEGAPLSMDFVKIYAEQ